jgi:hypothetical protein
MSTSNGVFKGNGNKFKGNKQTKGVRNRKRMIADFNSGTDRYAKIVSLEGGRHAMVLPLDSTDNKPISVMIKGIHHKKIWFKRDDLVVIRDGEIEGRVNDTDRNKVQREFDKLDGDKSSHFIFQNDNEFSDDENSGEEESKVPAQPKRNFDISSLETKDNEEVNPDDINIDEI